MSETVHAEKVELIDARDQDVPLLTGFLGQLFALEKDFTAEPKRQARALAMLIRSSGNASVYKVMADGTPAGMVVLHLAISTAEGGWVGRIEDFYLKPGFRRRGIGGRVVEELVLKARKMGLKRLILAADKDNSPALKFHVTCGFERMNLISFVKRID